jgi:hypothetical protein
LAQKALEEMDLNTKHQIITARQSFGSGAPISIDAFTRYIVTLKDSYVIYCDSLHNSNRNLWQSFARGVACVTGDSRTKPRAAHLFTEIFGESLDRCSPNYCQFSFDVFAYDEAACGADIAQEAVAKKVRVVSGAGKPKRRLSVNWETDEDSPFAEDTDATEWKFQTANVAMSRWVSSSFALTHRAITYFKDQALGLVSPRSWNIRSLGEMDYDGRAKLTKEWKKEAAERITTGKTSTGDLKHARVYYDPTAEEKQAVMDSLYVDDEDEQVDAKHEKDSKSDDKVQPPVVKESTTSTSSVSNPVKQPPKREHVEESMELQDEIIE